MEKIIKSRAKIINDELKYMVSANYLSNFMQKFDYLLSTLKRMSFIPRYCREELDYIELTNKGDKIKAIYIPMTCFCDIPLHQISVHSSSYGKYGIALTKEWGVRKGLQTIHYVTPNTEYMNQFENSFNNIIDIVPNEPNEILDALSDTLLDQLLYMKPITGNMSSKAKSNLIKKNFHDEHEWRYIPKIKSKDLPFIFTDPNDGDYVVIENENQKLSESMKQLKYTYLNFEVPDIKYIFVENDKDRDRLIREILSFKGNRLKKIDKMLLISKIIVYSDFEEDI